MDYYSVLGLNENASDEDIKKAYRKLSLKHHPDRGGTGEEFKKINEAYSTLGDKEKRKMYHMQKNNPFMMGEGDPGIDNIFKMFFGGGIPGMSPGMPGMVGGIPGMPHVQIFRNGRPINVNQIRKPSPIIKTISIKIEDAFTGVTVPIQIERWIMVNNEKRIEKEKIYVPIKSGIDNGEIYVIKDKGNMINDTIKGDIKLFVDVKNNTKFTRDGLDLLLIKKLTLKEALTGFKFDIKHINGKTYTINNEGGNIIQPNFVKKISNLGMLRDNKQGNLVISFEVTFPEILTKDQMEKLKEIL